MGTLRWEVPDTNDSNVHDAQRYGGHLWRGCITLLHLAYHESGARPTEFGTLLHRPMKFVYSEGMDLGFM